MSVPGQTGKHSARADVFRSSPKNGHWFTPQNIAQVRCYERSRPVAQCELTRPCGKAKWLHLHFTPQAPPQADNALRSVHSVVGDKADASQFVSSRQLSRNHELTRTSAPQSSMAASIQVDSWSRLQLFRERRRTRSFSRIVRIRYHRASSHRRYDARKEPNRVGDLGVATRPNGGLAGQTSPPARRRSAGPSRQASP